MRATHDSKVSDGTHIEVLVPLFDGVKSFPPPAVYFEGRAAIGKGSFRQRISL